MKKLLFLLILAVSPAWAEDIYLAQSALGSDTGANAANAHAHTWINTAGNWDTDVSADGKIGPGDTVHLVGTINITTPMRVLGSGTAGNPITIKFDSGSRLRHPTGFTSGMIWGANNNYVTLEGQNPSPVKVTGPLDTTVPDLECYQNGTPGVYPQQVQQTRWIFFEGGIAASNITIKNLYCKDLYVRTYGSPTDFFTTASGISVRAGSNILIQNVRIKNATSGPNIQGNGNPCTNLVIRDCYITDVSNGIHMGCGTSTTVLAEPRIVDNRIDHLARWSGPETGGHHNDGIQTIADVPGMQIRNLTVAYNWIGPNVASTEGSLTSLIFLAHGNTGARVYNNLLQLADNHKASNPVMQGGTFPNVVSFPGAVQGLFANNTITAGGRGPSGTWLLSAAAAVQSALVQGNIAVGVGAYLNMDLTGQSVIPSYSDYNVWYGADDDEFGTTNPGSIRSVASWQGLGYDTHSVFTNPNADRTTGAIPSNSSARNLAPTQTLFNDDFYHNPRTVPWDAGAVEFAEGGPAPPTIISATINSSGNQFSITLSRAGVFGAGGNGGMTVTSSSGAVTLGTPSISGSVIAWPISNRIIGQVETLTRTYVQPGNGIEAQDDQADLSSFSLVPLANGSTVAQVGIPVFSPVPGAYSSTQNVAITVSSPPPGTTIRYTTNGTDPTASSTEYTAPIPTSLSTTYKAKAFAGGFLDSPVATGAYTIGDFVIGNAWTNVAVAPQTGSFTWSFRATSTTAPNDSVMALSDHAATGYTDLAVIMRFSASGNIDAFNGTSGNYTAVNTFPYTAGQAYDFVVTVNVPAHTFSATVVQAGGSTPTTIATNYPFRSTQAGVVDLDNFAAIATLGSVTVSNMIFSQIGTAISLTGIATNTAGTQVTATFNTQPSFGLGGQGGFSVSASGGATTPSSPTIGTNAITWNLSRTIGRGETISATYVQPGNGIEAASGGADLTSFAGQSAVNNSTVDLTAPTPNPSTFGIAPTALTSSTITMTATTSTDANSPPVQYFFNEVSGNAGGSDSGWQSSSTFTDAGLAAGTQYRYRVQVRDSAVPPNVTTFSQEFSATTKSVAGAHPAMPFNMARANIVTP